MPEPNAICRACGKPYYVCNYCTRTRSYNTFTCSEDCYKKYVQDVLDQRKKDNDKFKQEYANIYTSRHDINEQQYEELMNKSIQEVIEETKIELKDYISKYPNLSIIEIVSIINKEIEEEINKKINKEVEQNKINEVKTEVTQEQDSVTPAVNKRKKRSRR